MMPTLAAGPVMAVVMKVSLAVIAPMAALIADLVKSRRIFRTH